MKKKVLSTLFLLTILGLSVQSNESLAYSTDQEYFEYSQTPSIYYQNGMDLLNSHQYTKAITEFKKALRENPQDKSSKIQLINAYILRAQYYNNQVTDYNRAANDLRSAIFYMKYYENAPVDMQYINDLNAMQDNLSNILYAINADQTPKGRYTMGKSLRAQGEFAASIVEFQSIKNDINYRKMALANLGEIYYIMNLNTQAISYLEDAITMDANNVNLRLKLAGAYERIGNLDKAVFQYNYALTQSDKNEDILLSLENIWKQKIFQNPNDAEAYANLGAVYQKRNNFSEALAQYEKAEQINPSNITTRLNIGTLYQAKKDYETAIEAYDTIIAVSPNYVKPYLYKAQCYKAMGNIEAAKQNYKLVLNLEPQNTEAKNELTELLFENMTADEKLNYMAKQLSENPSNAELTYQYAYELHKANKIEQAITYYKQTLKLNPRNENAYINLAQAYQQQDDFDLARSILSTAKGLFPENLMIKRQLISLETDSASQLYSRASELYLQKKYQEAIALYKKIVPATAESLIGLGACYQSLNDNKTAAEYYEKSFTINNKNAEIAYYASYAYSNIENFDKAKFYINKTLEIDANNEKAKELLTYINAQENSKKLDDAMVLIDKKDYVKALSLLNDFISHNPQEANAYYYRAMVYDAQKNYNAAINDYKKAIEINPKLIISYYSIAVAYDYLAQYKNALIYHKKYVEESQKIGEANDYTKYSEGRIQDLKDYENKPTTANTAH